MKENVLMYGELQVASWSFYLLDEKSITDIYRYIRYLNI